jgi:hypothetical protein
MPDYFDKLGTVYIPHNLDIIIKVVRDIKFDPTISSDFLEENSFATSYITTERCRNHFWNRYSTTDLHFEDVCINCEEKRVVWK